MWKVVLKIFILGFCINRDIGEKRKNLLWFGVRKGYGRYVGNNLSIIIYNSFYFLRNLLWVRYCSVFYKCGFIFFLRF